MTDNQTSIEDIYIGTKEVSENLKFDISKLQQWIDANIQSSGKIQLVEQFKGGQSNPTYKIKTEK